MKNEKGTLGSVGQLMVMDLIIRHVRDPAINLLKDPVPGEQAIQLLMLDLIMNSSPMFCHRGKSRAPNRLMSLGGVVEVATCPMIVAGHVGTGSTALPPALIIVCNAKNRHTS